MSDQTKCRVCSCVETRACITFNGPCYWVEPGLCSGCAGIWYAQHGFPDVSEGLPWNVPLTVEVTHAQLFMIISQLQLPFRHPRNSGPARQIVERATRQFAEQLSQVSPLWRFLLEAGWDAKNDVPAEQPLIIRLPGYRRP
jgi:hypothetical protein